MVIDDAAAIESSIETVTLTTSEESSVAYVAGWLERKCKVLIKYNDAEPLVASDVKEFVGAHLRCLINVPKNLSGSDIFVLNAVFVYAIGPPCDNLLRYLASVILNGLNNLEKDYQTN